MGLDREAGKRETGSIRSGEISGGGVDLGSELYPGNSGIPCFHLNSRVSHFIHKCHLRVNSVEFNVDAVQITSIV